VEVRAAALLVHRVRLPGGGAALRRALACLGLLACLVGWYELAPHVGAFSLWPSIWFIALVLMPLNFLLVWLALPLWNSRLLLPLGIGLAVLAVVFSKVDVAVASNFCKLFALTFLGWWFLGYFEAVSWVVLVALLIPWVDAYSVWRGPTNKIVTHHEHVFTLLSFSFPVPGENGAAKLGLPDLMFFALFLAAAVRFNLRVGWTWIGLTASVGATMALATWWDVGGLPALPLLSAGFLVPNADLLWRAVRSPAPAA